MTKNDQKMTKKWSKNETTKPVSKQRFPGGGPGAPQNGPKLKNAKKP